MANFVPYANAYSGTPKFTQANTATEPEREPVIETIEDVEEPIKEIDETEVAEIDDEATAGSDTEEAQAGDDRSTEEEAKEKRKQSKKRPPEERIAELERKRKNASDHIDALDKKIAEIKKEQDQKERRERNHRLIQIGAITEKYAGKLTDLEGFEEYVKQYANAITTAGKGIVQQKKQK